MSEEEQKGIVASDKSKLIVEKVRSLDGKCPIKMEYNKSTLERKLSVKDGLEFTEIIKNLCGTSEDDLAFEIINNGIGSVIADKAESKFNVCCQSLSDAEVKDITEARLVLQANSLYSQGMKCLERGEASDKFKGMDFFMKYGIKLLRLHNETIETLSKYRRGGEQRVIVQHVNVNQGGQAVVCGVSEGGGDATKK